MSACSAIVTLTTDFGQGDYYVAQMKGVILSLVPHARIVDVTHEIPPQDVRHAAFLVSDLADAFPRGTVHLAVVDPGVGSARRIIAVRADGQYYIAPDNGLLSLVFDHRNVDEIVSIENRAYHRQVVTATFHGRDIMAPAAAHVLNGVPPDRLGPRLEQPIRLEGLAPVVAADHVAGQVAWVDRFGNVITNVHARHLADFNTQRFRLSVGGESIGPLRQCYSDVPAGGSSLLIGSSGRLEIAVNGGSAAERYGLAAGMPLRLDTI